MDDEDREGRKSRPSGETSPWLAMARELVTNPDSPKSLAIQSSFNRTMRPRQQAVDQLVLAMADGLDCPSPQAEAAVAAAVKHWEAACGGPIDPETLNQFRQDALKFLERRRRRPPAIESVIEGVKDRLDVGYEQGIHLEGLRGTWHRLWASLSLAKSLGDAADPQLVETVRAQFEEALGRALSPEEWSKLVEHAHKHAEEVMRPLLAREEPPAP